MSYNQIECEDYSCAYCNGHARGYKEGKSKVFFKVESVAKEFGRHHASCGCRPCITIREVLKHAGGE